MKTFLKIFVVLCNLAILVMAVRWFSKENIYEPAIVVVGQLASLVSIALDNSGNVSLTNFKRTTFKAKHSGSGNFKAKDMDDSDVTFN